MKGVCFGISAAAALLAAGCGGGSAGGLGSGGPAVTVDAAPSSIAFTGTDTAPTSIGLAISLAGNAPVPTGATATLTVADPAIADVSLAAPAVGRISGSAARTRQDVPAGNFVVTRYAAGATTITASYNGASTTIPVNAQSCGRPAPAALGQLAYPANGASGVSLALPAVYVEGYYPSNATPPPAWGSAHLVGAAAAAPLVLATLPPGAPRPTPIPLPNETSADYRADLSASLRPGTTYRVQLVLDACQPPVILGSFST